MPGARSGSGLTRANGQREIKKAGSSSHPADEHLNKTRKQVEVLDGSAARKPAATLPPLRHPGVVTAAI